MAGDALIKGPGVILGPLDIKAGKVAWNSAGSELLDEGHIGGGPGSGKTTPMAPVPYPPPPPGNPVFQNCTATPPTGQESKMLVNPNMPGVGATHNGNPFITAMSMWLQGTSGFPACQPQLGMATAMVTSNTLPLMLLNDLMVSAGIINGAGMQPP